MRAISVLDAPSNLGLSPPEPGLVPGVYKLGWAVRDAGLITQLKAADCGVVVPPRYRPDSNPGVVRNQAAIAHYSQKLADRIVPLIRSGGFPLVLGGDCSILLGPTLAMRRLGRFGLAFVDGHSDFRHPGNSAHVGPVGAAAGEDLAIVTGRGNPVLTNIEGLSPLVRDEDVVAIGLHADDPCREEIRASQIQLVEVDNLRTEGAAVTGRRIVEKMAAKPIQGYWIHLDADVLDPSLMPAVDAPAPGGLTFEEVEALLRELAVHPRAVGLELTVFDPDLDEDGKLARRLARTLRAALS
jgi:arginase